jgi:gamma-glutamyltranspeptidase
VWIRELPSKNASSRPLRSTRITNAAGAESFPAWAPDGTRLAYLAARPGQGRGVWVSPVTAFDSSAGAGSRRGGGGGGGGGGGTRFGAPAAVPATDAAMLASRHAGAPAWSPDGLRLAIASLPSADAAYNGNPLRNDDDPPVALGTAGDYVLWIVDAPRVVDAAARSLSPRSSRVAPWVSAFDEVWQTLKSLYYSSGSSAAAWDALRAKYRSRAVAARDATSGEDAIDAMVAEQPLIKSGVESRRAVIASGSPLASDAGARILDKGGNVVDAGIAVAFALGVVEPDATSIGGDGQAILFLNGMRQPVVIEYKDMTPGEARPDNPKLFTASGSRTANDGPTVANIPGVVAGLDLLYQKYGSKRIAWADLIAPAIALADNGFVLDEALPTTIAEGRASFAKYPESAKVFMPGGKVPKPGDRFVNKDYAATLRTLAADGAQAFYRGSIARRIAADMAEHGGVISADDLAQYRAVERQPLSGRYHGYAVYSAPPPVATGAQLVETLDILDNYRPAPGTSYRTNADFLHYVIEAWRVRDGGGRIGDPDRTPVDLGNHLEAAHALERFKLISPTSVYVAPAGARGAGGVLPGVSGDDLDPEPAAHVQTGTTAFVVADAQGNMIAFTQTLSTWGGNYYVSKDLGFLYNDHFRGGGRGTQPLTRSSSTSVPTLVFEGGLSTTGSSSDLKAKMAVGCAGNAWIPASVYNIITNVLDAGMTAQQAIEAPRLLIGNDPQTGKSRVQIEDRIPRSILADLEARGHSFTKIGRKGEVKYGYAALAVVNASQGTVEAGAEPRRSHGTAAPTGDGSADRSIAPREIRDRLGGG